MTASSVRYLLVLILGSFLLFLVPTAARSQPQSDPLSQPQKVLIDMDLGSDIDDAYALGLLLSSPGLEVVGITVANGITQKRAQIACRMLYKTGMEHIPVAVGRKTARPPDYEEPAQYKPQYYWAEGFSKIKPIEQPAAEFIIETLRQYPDEVIVITVGPVTNIGDVIDKDPEALKLAEAVISMFGSFYMGYNRSPVPSAEWNVRADVEAAQQLAASGADITYVGLDVTTFARVGKEAKIQLLMRSSPLTDALSALRVLWESEPHSKPLLHDAVAVGMVLWPALYRTHPAHVRVTDEGYTIIDESKPPNAEIAVSINHQAFKERFMDRLLHQSLGRQ